MIGRPGPNDGLLPLKRLNFLMNLAMAQVFSKYLANVTARLVLLHRYHLMNYFDRGRSWTTIVTMKFEIPASALPEVSARRGGVVRLEASCGSIATNQL